MPGRSGRSPARPLALLALEYQSHGLVCQSSSSSSSNGGACRPSLRPRRTCRSLPATVGQSKSKRGPQTRTTAFPRRPHRRRCAADINSFTVLCLIPAGAPLCEALHLTGRLSVACLRTTVSVVHSHVYRRYPFTEVGTTSTYSTLQANRRLYHPGYDPRRVHVSFPANARQQQRSGQSQPLVVECGGFSAEALGVGSGAWATPVRANLPTSLTLTHEPVFQHPSLLEWTRASSRMDQRRRAEPGLDAPVRPYTFVCSGLQCGTTGSD